MENSCGMKVSRDGMEYLSGMEVSSVERPAARPTGRRPPLLPTLPDQPRPRPPPLHRPWIDCIIITVNDTRGLMDGPCDVDASSSYDVML